MSLQDQGRVLKAIYEVTKDDPERGASFDQINDHMGRPPEDSRAAMLHQRIGKLLEAGYVEVAGDRARITPKGVAAVAPAPIDSPPG